MASLCCCRTGFTGQTASAGDAVVGVQEGGEWELFQGRRVGDQGVGSWHETWHLCCIQTLLLFSLWQSGAAQIWAIKISRADPNTSIGVVDYITRSKGKDFSLLHGSRAAAPNLSWIWCRYAGLLVLAQVRIVLPVCQVTSAQWWMISRKDYIEIDYGSLVWVGTKFLML